MPLGQCIVWLTQQSVSLSCLQETSKAAKYSNTCKMIGLVTSPCREKGEPTVPIWVLSEKDSGPTVSLAQLLTDRDTKVKDLTEKSSHELTFISEGIPPILTKVVKKIEKGE